MLALFFALLSPSSIFTPGTRARGEKQVKIYPRKCCRTEVELLGHNLEGFLFCDGHWLKFSQELNLPSFVLQPS